MEQDKLMTMAQKQRYSAKQFLIPLIALSFALTACSTIRTREGRGQPQVSESPLSDEVILDHKYFTISYNKTHRLPHWVKYTLTKSDLNGPGVRPKRFRPDPLLIALNIEPVVHNDYTHSGYTRGHMAPAEDFSRSQEAIEETFIMSNVIPQKAGVNSGSWAQLEKKVRSWACGEEKITVITGPVLSDGMAKIKDSISIPNEFFKVVIDETPPRKAIAFVYIQTEKKQKMENKQVPLLEVLTRNHLESEVVTDSHIKDWDSCY